VPANGTRFYKATSTAAGDRATLVWNRRASPCRVPRTGCAYDTSSGYHVYTLSDLDLAAYSHATGALEDDSASRVDNVEQVRTTAAGEVIYKVTAGGVDLHEGEPFALAGTRELTPLITPRPSLELGTSATKPVAPAQDVTVTATVANPSGDLAAPGTSVALNLPPGVELEAGGQTQMLGTLGTKESATATWTVRGTTDGLKHLSATASTSVYGSTLTATDDATLDVDAAGPHLTLTAPSGTTRDRALVVGWSGSDPSGVASYDVDAALNGGPFAPWLTATSATTAAYTGTPGNRYRFRVCARDTLGNLSPFLTADQEVVITDDPPGNPPPATRQQPGIVLISATRRRGRLRVKGAIDPRAGAGVAVTLSTRKRASRATASAHDGVFRAGLRIPARARRARLTLRYPGDALFAPETKRIAVSTR
jgi:hypothetical protein